jgi:hypothetical protein
MREGGLAGINELALGSCQLSGQGVAALGSSPPADLRWLDLSKNQIGLAGVEALARSPLAATLEELILDGTDLGDEGATALVAGSWPRLRVLSLRSCGLTDTAARLLAGSASMTFVPTIQVAGNRIRYQTFRDLGWRLRHW